MIAADKETIAKVQQIFHDAPKGNVAKYLPAVVAALQAAGLSSREMFLMAIATIRAETAGFAPISEGVSRFNTAPGEHEFGKYDFRQDLGNNGHGEGARYKGRGFIQLTGKSNYYVHGGKIGVNLVDNPERANESEIAAALLASFLKSREKRILEALRVRNFAAARRAVNGGSHGLKQFEAAYRKGETLFTA